MKKYTFVVVLLLITIVSICTANYVISPYKTTYPIFYDKTTGTFKLIYDANGLLLVGGKWLRVNETDPCFVAWQAAHDFNETDPCFVAWQTAYDFNETDPCFVAWQAAYDFNETDPCFVAWQAADINYTTFDSISAITDGNDANAVKASINEILNNLKSSGVINP
jgi:hypothetical protein